MEIVIQNRAKAGLADILELHKLIANLPDAQLPEVSSKKLVKQSPVKYYKGYDKITPTQQEQAWFTDGSVNYVGNEHYWRTTAFNSSNKQILEKWGKEQSSQYAELYSVFLALQYEEGKKCHLFTDS